LKQARAERLLFNEHRREYALLDVGALGLRPESLTAHAHVEHCVADGHLAIDGMPRVVTQKSTMADARLSCSGAACDGHRAGEGEAGPKPGQAAHHCTSARKLETMTKCALLVRIGAKLRVLLSNSVFD